MLQGCYEQQEEWPKSNEWHGNTRSAKQTNICPAALLRYAYASYLVCRMEPHFYTSTVLSPICMARSTYSGNPEFRKAPLVPNDAATAWLHVMFQINVTCSEPHMNEMWLGVLRCCNNFIKNNFKEHRCSGEAGICWATQELPTNYGRPCSWPCP